MTDYSDLAKRLRNSNIHKEGGWSTELLEAANAVDALQARVALLEEKFGIAYQVAGRLIDEEEQPELVKLLDMLCDPDGKAWESEQ